jgi:uncharacterized membrane protein
MKVHGRLSQLHGSDAEFVVEVLAIDLAFSGIRLPRMVDKRINGAGLEVDVATCSSIGQQTEVSMARLRNLIT